MYLCTYAHTYLMYVGTFVLTVGTRMLLQLGYPLAYASTYVVVVVVVSEQKEGPSNLLGLNCGVVERSINSGLRLSLHYYRSCDWPDS